jgi:hypothetical protein
MSAHETEAGSPARLCPPQPRVGLMGREVVYGGVRYAVRSGPALCRNVFARDCSAGSSFPCTLAGSAATVTAGALTVWQGAWAGFGVAAVAYPVEEVRYGSSKHATRRAWHSREVREGEPDGQGASQTFGPVERERPGA